MDLQAPPTLAFLPRPDASRRIRSGRPQMRRAEADEGGNIGLAGARVPKPRLVLAATSSCGASGSRSVAKSWGPLVPKPRRRRGNGLSPHPPRNHLAISRGLVHAPRCQAGASCPEEGVCPSLGVCPEKGLASREGILSPEGIFPDMGANDQNGLASAECGLETAVRARFLAAPLQGGQRDCSGPAASLPCRAAPAPRGRRRYAAVACRWLSASVPTSPGATSPGLPPFLSGAARKLGWTQPTALALALQSTGSLPLAASSCP